MGGHHKDEGSEEEEVEDARNEAEAGNEREHRGGDDDAKVMMGKSGQQDTELVHGEGYITGESIAATKAVESCMVAEHGPQTTAPHGVAVQIPLRRAQLT